ncbi:MAG: flippase [Lachnospiraceae bacterium]|nr:flippase [Lachnospiraceae bacterium]
MKKKSIKINIVFNIIRVAINLMVPMIVFPYVSQILGPDHMGKISFVTAVNNFFCLFSMLGISSYGILICSKLKDDTESLKRSVAELIYINLLLISITYVIYYFCICCLNHFKPYKELLFIYSLVIFFNAVGMEWLYLALEEFTYITIRTFIVRSSSVVFIFLLVKNRDDYITYVWILVITIIVTNLMNLFHIRSYIKIYNPFKLAYKKHWISILIFFSASFASTISANIDTTMLGIWSTDYWVGIYSFSVKIKTLLVTIISGIVSAALPRLTYNYNNRRLDEYSAVLRKIFILLLIISVGLTGFFIVEAEDIILLLGGKEYLNGRNSMLILTASVIVMAVTYTFGVCVLQATGNEKQYAKSIYISCIVNVVVNAVLIPVIGVNGAAFATVISEVINAILFINKSNKIVGKWYHDLEILKFVFASVVASFLVYLLNFSFSGMAIIVRILFLFLVYFLVYILVLLGIHNESRINIRNAIKNRK